MKLTTSCSSARVGGRSSITVLNTIALGPSRRAGSVCVFLQARLINVTVGDLLSRKLALSLCMYLQQSSPPPQTLSSDHLSCLHHTVARGASKCHRQLHPFCVAKKLVDFAETCGILKKTIKFAEKCGKCEILQKNTGDIH